MPRRHVGQSRSCSFHIRVQNVKIRLFRRSVQPQNHALARVVYLAEEGGGHVPVTAASFATENAPISGVKFLLVKKSSPPHWFRLVLAALLPAAVDSQNSHYHLKPQQATYSIRWTKCTTVILLYLCSMFYNHCYWLVCCVYIYRLCTVICVLSAFIRLNEYEWMETRT